MRRIAGIAALVLAVLATGLPADAQVAEPNIRVTAQRPDSRLKTVTKRVIFSTADNEDRPARLVRVRNIGNATLNVSSMAITGTNASHFDLPDADAADGFSLAPGEFRDVPIDFEPTGAPGRYAAALETDSNDPGSPTTVTTLKGLNAIGYEEANEPTLFSILSTLGYEPAGLPMTNLNPNIIYEDEVRTAFFRPSKSHGRVALIPMARYSTVIPGSCCPAGWYEARNPLKTKHRLQNWSGGPAATGENQKLMPVPGVPPSVNLTDNGDTRNVFTPGQDFGLYSGSDMSGNPALSMRFFHARRADRDNYYEDVFIVVEDQGTGANGTSAVRNFDHNDFVWLLVNATPVA